MSYLARSKKIDLITLINELSLVAAENSTKPQLIEVITKKEGYDEDFVKNLLLGIVSEREELEKKLEAKEAESREYELKKLQLEMSSKSQSDSSPSPAAKNPDVLKLISRYDSQEEISIYLTLFERQIKRLGVEKENWVTYLLGLLPMEFVSVISREKEEDSNDYDYVKQLLLKRFKLSPEQFRQKFFTHKRDSAASWKDFSFELSNFLDEWLKGLKILTYDDLKSVLIIDQIRKKLPSEIKEHFIDELPKFTKVADFVSKLDD